MSKDEFLKLITNQRNKKKNEKFKGTFIEYLQHIQDDPSIVKLAHKRLFKSIESRI